MQAFKHLQFFGAKHGDSYIVQNQKLSAMYVFCPSSFCGFHYYNESGRGSVGKNFHFFSIAGQRT